MRSRAMRGRPFADRLDGTGGLLLVPAAALIVHQLRYTLAYGSQAGTQLADTGHSYQHSLVPWAVGTLGVGVSMFLRRAARALRTGETGRFEPRSARALWALATVGLLAVYSLQESLEELFASGHPTGLAGLFGHGGWWAVPASAAVAAALVGLLRLGRAVLRLAAGAVRRPLPGAVPALRPAAFFSFAPAPLARAAAGRAPPLTARLA